MAKIISIINNKGGVGKTTTAANLGTALCMAGKKVLLVDFDPQANLSLHFGVQEKEKTILHAMKGNMDKTFIRKLGADLPHLLPSSADLSVAEITFAQEAGREYLLQECLSSIKRGYDYILVDCPPALGILTLNALSTSQEIIIPLELSKFSLAGMGQIFAVVDKVHQRINKDLKQFRLLITKTDGRKTLHKELAGQIQEAYGAHVFQTAIRTNVQLEEAQMKGMSIFAYAPHSSGAKDYQKLCDEIIVKEI